MGLLRRAQRGRRHAYTIRYPRLEGSRSRSPRRRGWFPSSLYDGGDLDDLEAAERPSALWRLPLAGGAPSKVLEGVVNGAFDVVERGIYYIDRGPVRAGDYVTDRQAGETRLQFFDFATRRVATVADNLGMLALGTERITGWPHGFLRARRFIG